VSSGSVAESESEPYGTPQNWDERQDEIASDDESNQSSDTDYFADVAAMESDVDDDILIDESRSTIPKTPPPPPELALEGMSLDEKSDIEKYMYLSL
jgi:hypothetical protein